MMMMMEVEPEVLNIVSATEVDPINNNIDPMESTPIIHSHHNTHKINRIILRKTND
jgi:hypothetical protein